MTTLTGATLTKLEGQVLRLLVHEQEPVLLEYAHRRAIRRRHSCAQRSLVDDLQEVAQRCGRDPAAPLLAPKPVTDHALAAADEGEDVARDLVVVLDRADGGLGIGPDSFPVRIENRPLTARNAGERCCVCVALMLEESVEIGVLDLAQPHLLRSLRRTTNTITAMIKAIAPTCAIRVTPRPEPSVRRRIAANAIEQPKKMAIVHEMLVAFTDWSSPLSTSRRLRERRTAVRLLGNERNLARSLEARPRHVVQRCDLRQSGLPGQLIRSNAGVVHVLLDHAAVLDQADRLAFQQLAHPPGPERHEAEHDLDSRDREDRRERTGHRVVVLRQTLLDRVAEDDQQDEVDGLHLGELAPPDHAQQHVR